MHRATYDDAVIVARILKMDVEAVWQVIQDMPYHYYSELKIAVLNSPKAPASFRR